MKLGNHSKMATTAGFSCASLKLLSGFAFLSDPVDFRFAGILLHPKPLIWKNTLI